MKIVIEIGSNLGTDTIILLNKFPDATFYCFEPTRELVGKILWEDFADNKNVHFFPFAIDTENSFKKFNVTGVNDWGSSSLYDFVDNAKELWNNEHPGLEVTHSYYVPTITLYDFCNLYNINQIDYLWIDAQGNDFNCLKSLKDKINIVKEGVCEADYSAKPYKDCSNYYKDIIEWLEKNNFVVSYEVDQYWPQQVNLNFKRNE